MNKQHLRQRICGIYAITPDELDTKILLHKTAEIIRGGAQIIQYRNKIAAVPLRKIQAHALAALCNAQKVLFIINDHLDLALEVAGAGLHSGATDGNLAQARAALGPNRLLGASCYDSLELAAQAVQAGADYVAFGSVFASSTKPTATRVPLELFSQAKKLQVPLVAIGGIQFSHITALVQAGADVLALISSLYNALDPHSETRRFVQRLHEQHPRLRLN